MISSTPPIATDIGPILACVTATTPIDVPALKEWAAVVHALLEGEQVVDLRKGGLHEDGRHFDVPARSLWLYPTAEHQRPELLKAGYRHWTDLALASPVGETIVLPGWAEITDVATITEPGDVAALDSKSIWTADYAQSRLRWKQRDPLWVLVLRVHRVREPIAIGWNDSYGGCTSWVSLAGLPEVGTVASEPVLSDVAFEAKRKGVRDSLPRADWR
jgi:hypothetical protein